MVFKSRKIRGFRLREGAVKKRTYFRRQLCIEPLEIRSLMCSDLLASLGMAQGLADVLRSGNQDSETGFGLPVDTRFIHSHSPDASIVDQTQISDEPTETSILRLDPLDVGILFAAAAPASLGVFTQAALTFATLANGMPILNSSPSSPTSIFLDLDGDTTTSTDPYDEDSAPTTFNTTEQKNIAEAWRHISTYFAMFDVNVTTIPPSTPKAWLASGNNISGGYSYVGVFPNSKPQSFNQDSNVRTRQSGLAHELGHNFGLSHQKDYNSLGVLTNEYSSGFDTLHGPIMGVDYAQTVHKWFIGHAGSASTLQDDMSVIAGKIDNYQPTGGDGYHADDFGNTIATAKVLTEVEDVYSISGTIERLADVDAFAFNSLGTPITVSALPDKPSGVDLKLEIHDALGTLIASKDATTNNQEITLTLPVGTFYVLLSSHKNYGDVGTYSLAIRPLPTDWTARDIGGVGLTGFSQYDSATDVFSMGGSGADVSGTAVEMQFSMQTLNGDGTIIARVASITNTDSNAKAGIEIRDGTASNAKHVALVQTYSNGQQWITRDTPGASSVNTGAASQTFAAKWLKLTRVGDVFTSFVSNDGVTYTQKGTKTISMSAKVNIGLMVTAKNDSRLNIATFDHVTLTGDLGPTPPVYNSLPIPTSVAITRTTGSDLNISWADVAGETGYRVERSVDGITFTTAGTTAANVTTYDDPDLFGSLRYYYQVKAINGSTTSAPSVIRNAINRPNAVTNFAITSLNTTQTVLNWRDTHGESGYRIERSLDGTTYTQIGTVGTNIPSYTDSGLTTATVYSYRVIPTSSLGDGDPTIASDSTRLAKVGGLAFDAVGKNSIQFHWSNITAETSFRIERSTDGATFTTLTTVTADITTYTDSTVSAVSEYYYRVTGVNSMTESVSPSNVIFTATLPNGLAAPWQAVDIGSNAGDGSTNLSSGVFKIISSGSDIASTADGFRFTYQALQGDGSITAKIATQQSSADTAKTGVMIRETLAADSKHASVFVQPVSGVVMRSRSTAGAADSGTAGPAVAAPYWVRLTRVGNVLTGFSSLDGVTWTQIATKTISMASKVYIGLAATATSTTFLNTSTVDNVTFVGNAKVTNRRIFYNNSTSVAFGNGSGNPLNAIDSSKVALLSGQTSTAANYSNFVRGLNGIIIDVDGLVSAAAADFQFATWNGIDTAGFRNLTVPPTVSTFVGGGLDGATRVKLVFGDNLISNTWLKVTVLANAHTDLTDNDVFYFGNAIADVYLGNSGTPVTVRTDETDVTGIRTHQSPVADSVPLTNAYDINKDGRVNMIDLLLARQRLSENSLRYITAPISLQLANAFYAGNFPTPLAPIISNAAGTIPTVNLSNTSTTKPISFNTGSLPPIPTVTLQLRLNPLSSTLNGKSLANNEVALNSDTIQSLDDFFRKLGSSIG